MSFNEKKSYTEYNVTSSTSDFAIGFKEYGLPSDTIKVTIDNVDADIAGYTVTRKNDLELTLTPPVSTGVVRLQRETNIDESFHVFSAGAKFVAANMDSNFNQILHSQQEVADGFDKLKLDVYPLVNGLEEALEQADAASQAAQEAAEAASEAAQISRSAASVLDSSGLNQQQVNNGLAIPSDLNGVATPQVGNRVYVKATNAYYTYTPSTTEVPNGVTVVGKWVMDRKDVYLASWFATPNVQVDQSSGLQTAWDYAASKKALFVVDAHYWVAQKPRTYADTLVRKVGLQIPNNSNAAWVGDASIRLIPNAEPLAYVINGYLADNFNIWNPVIYGDADTHLGTTDESNHCLNLVNCTNGYVHKPKLYDAWGDGLYIGTEFWSATNKQCENITVFEPYAKHCGRAGISVTSGINVTVVNPTFDDIYRVAPKVGINIEGEGIGECKPVLRGIRVQGTVLAHNCDVAASTFIYDSVQGDVDISIGDVVAHNCVVPVVTQLFSDNKGCVVYGDITGFGWVGAVLRSMWSQRNCTLTIGNLYSIDANCNGTIERYSSVISMDIDAPAQPLMNLGNIVIGSINIKDSTTTKVMHPFYFKDNTGAGDGVRKLDNITIGDVYGSTLNTVFYVDGHVTSNFKFNVVYTNQYYRPPHRPYLYSVLNSVVTGNDPFELTLHSSYKTSLVVHKRGTSSTNLVIKFPTGTAMYPAGLGSTFGIKTATAGSTIGFDWVGNAVYLNQQLGTWVAI